MSEKICGIYKITNLVNGKVYIGQSIDIYDRWREHRKPSQMRRENIALYNAFKKYGIKNFSFEILDQCNVEQLDDKEIYYIALCHSYIKDPLCNGYNMTIGGALCHTHVGSSDQGKRVYQYDINGCFVDSYRNQSQAASSLGLKSNTSINAAIKRKGLAGGFQWRDMCYKCLPKYEKGWQQEVAQYSLNGDFIRKFKGCIEAGAFMGCSDSLIQLCCSGASKTGMGYQWSYEIKDKIPKVKPMEQPSKWKTVYQFSKDGKFIQSFPCAKIAHKETQISYRAITHCLHGESKTGGGFIWKYNKS